MTVQLRYTHPGNVFGLEQVVHVEEEIHRDPELKEIVDDLLYPVPGLHVLLGVRALLLTQRGGATLEDYLLDYPEERVKEENFLLIFIY